MDAKLKALFDAYEKAFSALDFEASAQFFGETFISAGPKGTIAQSKQQFMQLGRKAVEFYRSVGQEYAKILAAEETPLSDHYALVEVHWSAKFRKLEKPIEFDVSYIVDKTGSEAKIVMFIAHQDEQEAMKKLGLL